MSEPFLVAAAQVAPVFLDLEGCLEIACKWIAEAGEKGVRVLVFPETWLPGYPVWLDSAPEAALWNHPPVKAIYRRLVENCPQIPSPATERLCAAAAEAGLTLVMGLQERDGKTLYNSMVYISEDGELLGLHRKLVPTYTERLLWGRGDGSTLTVVDTPVGRVGGLVCWEHWMPLARQAMHQKRESVHAAVWPSVNEVHMLASRSYAFEGRCFVVAAGSVLRREHFPEGLELLEQMPGDGPFMRGGSAVIGPDGAILAGPAGEEETLVIAEVYPGRIAEESMTLDVSGHYSRPDVFTLVVDERPRSGG
jgi:predicted amidohydrolase